MVLHELEVVASDPDLANKHGRENQRTSKDSARGLMSDEPENVDGLLAQWAELLRHKERLSHASIVYLDLRYGVDEGDLATYGARGDHDLDGVLAVVEFFRRDIENNLTDVEARLGAFGIVVRRPSDSAN